MPLRRHRHGARAGLSAPGPGPGGGLEAWLFDLDGVLTDTARLHAGAWKETFDDVLRVEAGGGDFVPFGPADYARYVDGKPRFDGVRDFLASRGIYLPDGDRGDGPGRTTLWAVGNAKNEIVQRRLAQGDVTVFPGSVTLVQDLRGAGMRTAVVSASENCVAVLRAGGIEGLFDTVVDGQVATRHHLAGKPAPDTYLWAATVLQVAPGRAAVVEDALAGVAAGRAGGFGLVVGVARQVPADALSEAGADVVVGDLGDLVAGHRPRGPRPPV